MTIARFATRPPRSSVWLDASTASPCIGRLCGCSRGRGGVACAHQMTDEGAVHRFVALPSDPVVRPLSLEDRNILALETENVAGHTCKVTILDGQIEADRLRASIASRLDRATELRLCIHDGGGTPSWAPAAKLDLDAHVTVRASAVECDDAGLRSMVADLFEQRL